MITIPKISELYEDILDDFEAVYGITISLFGKVFFRALALVQAGKLKLYYLAIGKLQKNIFIDTADPEASGGTLERFGRIKLGRNPFAATAGQYVVTVTGTVGAVIEASTTFKSNDDTVNPGKLFILDNEYTLVGSDSITLRALEAGVDSKLEVGEELTATIPIAEVDKIVTVTSEAIAPLAAEEIEVYRTVGLQAYQLEPQGGAGSDYILWAADAQGVLRSYPYAKSGVTSEVNLFIEATIADSTDGKGTPSAQLLADVEEVVDFDPDDTRPLDERGRRPLTEIVNYLAVTIKQVDIEVQGFVGLTAAKETSILNAIKAVLDDIRPFVASANVLANKNDIIDINKVISTILNAEPGSIFTTVDLMINGGSVNTFTFENGDIPYLNSVTYYG
ncbi:hypothetical protein LCGC14_1643670 [marine sediment metagenome]|uniref:Uncharacterized protein n=1 Tax=marine sediment metagenome TaxID=412755 RepID=A0A0F9KES6_9ZZZZ